MLNIILSPKNHPTYFFMINFNNVNRIITHAGHAHRDDFLSVCFTLALCAEYNNEPVY